MPEDNLASRSGGDLKRWDQEHRRDIEIVYSLIDLEPRTYGQLFNVFGEGSPIRASGVLSNCLEVLQTRGKVVATDFKTMEQTKYFAVNSLGEKVSATMKTWKREIGDAFRKRVFGRKVVEEGTAEFARSYERNSFSAFLGNCTLAREGSGFEVEEYREWEFVKAKGARGLSEDVELEIEILNARFPEYDFENDQLKIRGNFKRPLGRSLRIPKTAQPRYVAKVFNALQEVGERTQVLSMHANGLLYAFRGDRREVLKALAALESGFYDPYSTQLSPVAAYLNEKFRPDLKGSTERRRECVEYMKGFVERVRI